MQKLLNFSNFLFHDILFLRNCKVFYQLIRKYFNFDQNRNIWSYLDHVTRLFHVLKAVWQGLSSLITYERFINKIPILRNYPKRTSIQKNATHYYVFFWKFVKIIILLIKWPYVINDDKPYHTALRQFTHENQTSSKNR